MLAELAELLAFAPPDSPLLDRRHPDFAKCDALMRQIQAEMGLGAPGVVETSKGRPGALPRSKRGPQRTTSLRSKP